MPIGHAAPLGDFVPGSVVVGLEAGLSAEALGAAAGLPLTDQIPQIRAARYQVPEGQEEAYRRFLSRVPGVRYAQPNYRVSALKVPTDPRYDSQWYLPKVSAPEGWDLTTGSARTILAVIDSGCNALHPDLKTKLVSGYNTVQNTAYDTSDVAGHGTWVAGLAAAATNNGVGVAGAAWDIAVMPVRVLDETLSGTAYDVDKGIIWATDHGAKVLNLSLGGDSAEQAERDAAKYAQNHDVLVVASAGNEYLTRNLPVYPAALPGVVAVGATTVQNTRASYSNTGTYLSLMAPGGDPVSEVDTDKTHWLIGLGSGEGYLLGAGTSGSCPLVSALAALLRDFAPDLTAEEVRGILISTATDLGPAGKDIEFGYGLVNYQAALSAAPAAKDTGPPLASLTAPLDGAVLAGDVTFQGTASDQSLLSYSVDYRALPYGEWEPLVSAKDPVTEGALGVWHTQQTPDGPYALRVHAQDIFAKTTDTAPIRVTLDNTAPLYSSVKPAAGSALSGAADISATVSDANLSSLLVEVAPGTAEGVGPETVWQPVPFTQAGGSGMVVLKATWDSSDTDNGFTVIRITAQDAAGNKAVRLVPVTVENKPPVALLEAPLEGAVVGGELAITGTASDDALASYQVECRGAASDWTSVCGSDKAVPEGSLGTWNTNGFSDGTYEIRVRAIAGHNRVAESAPVHLTVDNTAPTLSVVSPTAGTVVRDVVALSVTVSDPHFSKAQASVSSAGTPGDSRELSLTGEATGEGGTLSAAWDTGGLPSGAYTFRVTAEDTVGNSATLEVPVTLDAGVKGDLDGDGRVSVGDVVGSLRASLGLNPLTPAERQRADVSGDGQVTIADVMRILRKALGLA
jgi:hypothetical protein